MSDEDTRSWVFVGGLPFELTEGDVICVFSQYGEVAEINLVRDRETGKSRGFGFIKYEDTRSCELAVDNFSGTTIVGRRITVDYSKNAQAIRKKRPAIVAPETQDDRNDRNREQAIEDIRFDREVERPCKKSDYEHVEGHSYRSDDRERERGRQMSRYNDYPINLPEHHSQRDRHGHRSPSIEKKSHRHRYDYRSRSRSRSRSPPRRHGGKSSYHTSRSESERKKKKEKKSSRSHRRSRSSSRERTSHRHHNKHSRHH